MKFRTCYGGMSESTLYSSEHIFHQDQGGDDRPPGHLLEIPAVEEESTEAKAGVTIGASISVSSSERGARLDWRYTGGTTPTPLGPGTLSLVERLSSSHFLKILLNRNNLKLAIH